LDHPRELNQESFDVAQAKGQAPKSKKGREATLFSPSFSISAKRRGMKGMACQQRAEARIRERGTTAFFGEPNALLPVQGTDWEMIRNLFWLRGNR